MPLLADNEWGLYVWMSKRDFGWFYVSYMIAGTDYQHVVTLNAYIKRHVNPRFPFVVESMSEQRRMVIHGSTVYSVRLRGTLVMATAVHSVLEQAAGNITNMSPRGVLVY